MIEGDPWVGNLLSAGLQIGFTRKPNLTRKPVWTHIPANQDKATALRGEVDKMLLKGAVVEVQNPQSRGFYSKIFLVPKPGNRWRPVIDLSSLNAFIAAPRFKMETALAVRNAVNPGEYAISVDLTDAYFHLPMARQSQRYLRFAVDGKVLQFVCLPFGLNLAPWAFTRTMNAVMSHFRKKATSPTSNYLDDLLLRNAQVEALAGDRDRLLALLTDLGWLLNQEKSDLEPSQDFCHLGMRFRTDENRVGLTEKRIEKILTLVTSFVESKERLARDWLQLLGVMNAAAELLHLGRLFLRPVQMALMAFWRPCSGRLDQKVPIADFAKPHLRRWLDEDWLRRGVPLKPPEASRSICTDASGSGWGAHLLPSFEEIRGVWSGEEADKHINELELLAVFIALKHWESQLRDLPVMVLSDNSTTVCYIRKQGGTRAPHLCLLVWQILHWCDERGITLMARHIPGKLNVAADALSREGQIVHTEWSLCPRVFERICLTFGRPLVDMFATRWNAKLPTFVSPFPDPQAYAIDALSLDWKQMSIYAFPPTVLVPKVIKKIQASTCQVILVAPLKWGRSWISELLELATEIPRKIQISDKLLKQPRKLLFHPCPERLALHVWKLSSEPSPAESSVVRRWRESQPLEGPPL